MADPPPLLVLVGTYGEKLGHVDGKGEGVYALLLDRTTLAPHVAAAASPYHAKPQLGEAVGGETQWAVWCELIVAGTTASPKRHLAPWTPPP